jgi:hypothetical protein
LGADKLAQQKSLDQMPSGLHPETPILGIAGS